MHNETDKKRLKTTLSLIGWMVLVLVLAGINRLWATPFLRTPIVDAFRLCDITMVFLFAPLGGRMDGWDVQNLGTYRSHPTEQIINNE